MRSSLSVAPEYSPPSAFFRETPSYAPLVAEKKPTPCQTIESELGWRGFLDRIGVAAAIFSYQPAGMDGGRYAFLVGLDQIKGEPQTVEGLLAFAEASWQAFNCSAFTSFDPAEMTGSLAAPGSSPKAHQLVLGFASAATVQYAEQGATLTGLLLGNSPASELFNGDCRRRIEDVLPMFLHSAGADVERKRQQRQANLLSAMFDRVSLAVILLDANCRPIFTNDAADALLREQNTLSRAPDGTIACAGMMQAKAMRTAIRNAATSHEAGQEIVLRLDDGDSSPLLGFVVPTKQPGGGPHSRCAMLIVHTPRDITVSSPMLKALGLLPSEQRFVSSFLRSSSLSEAAGQIGLSEETARTYLKRVRAKLGVHRQMELAQLIYGLMPPLRHAAADEAA
jgi:DNA-directed RNA polymerase specialized sigma24 family protein